MVFLVPYASDRPLKRFIRCGQRMKRRTANTGHNSFAFDRRSNIDRMSNGDGTELNQRELNERKVTARIENEKYMRSHQELRFMISKATEMVLLEKPRDVPRFLADFFMREDLMNVVMNHPTADHEKTDRKSVV